VNTPEGANRNGFVSRMVRFKRSSELLAERLSCRQGGRTKARRYKARTKHCCSRRIGRQAPVKRCLARCCEACASRETTSNLSFL